MRVPEDPKVLLSLCTDGQGHIARPRVYCHLGVGHGFVVERCSQCLSS